MKKYLIVLALIASAGFAQAQSNSESTASSNSSPNVTSGNSAADSSSMSQSNPNNANQQLIQLNTYNPDQIKSTSTQTYSGVQRNINEGTTTNNQNIHYSGTQTVKNVPGIAMSGPASGPCTGMSGGVGVAGPGFGVGLNGSTVDKGCTVRENTRTAGQVYQALDSADPMKAEAKAALMEGLAVIRQMNATIAADVAKDAPQPAPKTAQAPAVQPVAMTAPKQGEPTDPYIRARMGLK